MSQSNDSQENAVQANGTEESAAQSEATSEEATSPEAAATEETPAKLTPLEAIKQAQAARHYNATGGGKRGGNKGQPFGQGGAAASRKPTTGRRSIGGA